MAHSHNNVTRNEWMKECLTNLNTKIKSAIEWQRYLYEKYDEKQYIKMSKCSIITHFPSCTDGLSAERDHHYTQYVNLQELRLPETGNMNYIFETQTSLFIH